MNKRTLYTYKWNLKRKFAKLEEEEAVEAGDAVGAIEAVEAGDAVENIPNNNKADSIECSNVNEGDIPCFAIDNEDVDLSFEENERSTKHKEISSILVELKSWAIRNNVPLNITTDLLKSLARSGITGLPATSRTLLGGHLCKAPSKTYLISRKGNLPLDSLFRSLATDEILDGYNWDGRCGKQPLKKIKLFGEVFTDVYCNLTKKEYEAQIRKSVELAHNRSKQRRLKQQTSQ